MSSFAGVFLTCANMEVGVGSPGALSPVTVLGPVTPELPVTTVSHFVSLSLT